ncbi:MAG TPA: SDR family NAD(P)-dependent oxidoreductase [Symbiobacteriaceae bacterium]|nr:SDR family NAD(P)-dependent oxidoreductase [Symbiobacteriaceae bacterium]
MKIIVLTGASSGIGEAAARQLAAEGHTLVLVARRLERLEALAQELGPNVHPYAADLTDPSLVQALADWTAERFGRIDLWINNAGMGGPIPWWRKGLAPIQQVVNLNLITPMLSVTAALPYMKRGAHFINIASVAGHVGSAGLYSATKFGLRGLSESLRRELRPQGIHVSILSPGFIRTEMTAEVNFPMPGPAVIARAISRLIRRPRRELVVPGWYRLLIWLDRYMPAAFTDWIMARGKAIVPEQ